MAATERTMTEAGQATLAERRAGMSDSRTGSGVELQIDHLYKVTGNRCSGRTYRVHEIADDKVLATEGAFEQLRPTASHGSATSVGSPIPASLGSVSVGAWKPASG
jgi:hypothetical protein